MSEQTKELPSLHANSAIMPPTEQLPVAAALKPRLVKISQINFRKIPLLANLTDEELTKLQSDLRIRKFSRREIVLQKGATGDSLLFVLVGQLQVVDVTEDGRAIGLRMLAPGDFFGEIAVINSSTRSASVLALTEALVGFLPAAMALHLFSHSPSVARQMLRHLAEKIQRDSEFRALLSIHNTSRRIYTFLQLFRKTLSDGSDVIDSLPTHQDIANMINTSRETVTRAILYLVQQGIVEKDTHRLIMRNAAEFQNLLRGSPA
ncbi:MAG: Crp/Fnr family transcriptional regulator [Burkholderiaceae bacterium]|nr:Crp/Fnr family transcriptional regulator [Burkholderiaceae bacterium]